eukprot:CAMPEP_0179451924 /NCGR_PEP_ID=MMETSP0799-20121207/35937_1 /TAXON_ID=46947 /ORGANISM="Geminigera cryophila, Strain CCMP2564" /LENGTH=179 /DNA_ID=CAMNT_0021247587 /DNA_START=202 /DNA_END=741 /DNA_ORIENTATION=+
MNISREVFKGTALARIQQLHVLFLQLHSTNIVHLETSATHLHQGEQGVAGDTKESDSIFGFSKITVNEMDQFHLEVLLMVQNDVTKCWHANGRPTLRQPTFVVYELLRQVGIHPVRGTCAQKGSSDAANGARDFLCYRQYAFCKERMVRNCHRLKIAQIAISRQAQKKNNVGAKCSKQE